MAAYTHKQWRMVATYSAAHFLVDFACAFLMFRSIAATTDWYLCILLYNFCAFAMQMPLGVVADRLRQNALFAIAGCALVASAYGLAWFPMAAAITAGIGNSLFHLGGGIDVLHSSDEKSGALGIFVSPGAFGVYFGTMLGKSSSLGMMPILSALLAAAALIFAFCRAYTETDSTTAPSPVPSPPPVPPSPPTPPLPELSPQALPIAAFLFLVVCLRSFVGFAISFPWKSAIHFGIPLTCAVVFGKTAGGFVADKIGAGKASILSLGLSALMFFLPQIPAVGILSMLLFNMTMPITLWAVAKAFPDAKGFSFGLLTFGLFLGFLPSYLGTNVPEHMFWLFPIAAAVSLALLWTGLRKLRLVLP